VVQERGLAVPRSTRTIWKVLRRHGRIAPPVQRLHEPIPRPVPLSAWQIDFKDASTVPADPYGKQQHVVEILNVVDMGTSILLSSCVHANFHAQTALEAMATILREQGIPQTITLDRDTRWVGSASGRDFPSAFLRFLLCLGIKPNVCPPHRPDLNAFVERFHRSLKQECLLVHRPVTEQQVREVTAAFAHHYNQERPHQGLSCGNRPPLVAFPDLPELPRVPELVDPDVWLAQVDGHHFVRKIRANGTILLDDVSYYVKQALAGQYVDVQVDAHRQEWVVWHQHQECKRLAIKGLPHTTLSFDAFVELMADQAHSEQRRQERARWQAQIQSHSA
jgi:transposase InsO family protein